MYQLLTQPVSMVSRQAAADSQTLAGLRQYYWQGLQQVATVSRCRPGWPRPQTGDPGPCKVISDTCRLAASLSHHNVV